ncbi:MAG: hypothetical protein FJ028_01925 [Chloroflexi bacterium]|nr:hypothetical protein [Chloroflexota bacterium]
MDLAVDDVLDGAQHVPRAGRREDEVERLRRGDEDARRLAGHAMALVRRRVAGAHGRTDLRDRDAETRRDLRDPREGRVGVALDVVVQAFSGDT